MKTQILLLIVFTLACGTPLFAQSSYTDSYTAYTGDDYEYCFSPGICPTQPSGGRHGTGWVQTYATCVYYPNGLPGGRGVGMGIRQYNSCSFPDTNGQSVETADDIPSRWVIWGRVENRSILWGYETYFWYAESTCSIGSPGDPWTADIVVMEEHPGGGC